MATKSHFRARNDVLREDYEKNLQGVYVWGEDGPRLMFCAKCGPSEDGEHRPDCDAPRMGRKGEPPQPT